MKKKIDYYKPLKQQLRSLNRFLDEDYKKLYDKKHDLELSHKRMEKLLKQCLYYFNRDVYGVMFSIDFKKNLIRKIRNELSYPYFRVNWKTKGGKNV